MDPYEIEEALEYARDLLMSCESDVADPSFIESLLEMCRHKQGDVRKILQDNFMMNEAILRTMTMLNDALFGAIQSAEMKLDRRRKNVVPVTPKINRLVERRDIFSLICMLRAQGEKRLDAALALMR